MILMAGFTAGNEKGELVVLAVTVPTIPPPCWPPVYVPIAVKSGLTLTAYIPAIRARCRTPGC
ncbi:Uncharacterised protein [Salmonella enterica subsp. arizonae]|uniref:Uncharacterized protein n=1 Tax=Salmonella enterica subsp. arizonae TaxID=59203 RepID=A0A379TPE9_SALER|nr:Uncharacterised protein [Salmonella enterica subsp. arizonae]